MDKKTNIDIIDIEVFNKLFSSVAEEMGIILTRASFSSNIKERRDFSCAVFDGHGRLIAQASHIPVHLGSMPKTLEAVIGRIDLAPGDIIITNDPFQGGSHLPDITLIEAVFEKEHPQPAFYVANRAHHADVGGISPGSMGLHRTIAQEGVLIPPTYLFQANQENTKFFNDFLARVRNPEERRGDLRAQQAALSRGRQRLTDMLHRYGRFQLTAVTQALIGYGRRLMATTIASIPDGIYSFTDFLDNDGTSQLPVPIAVTITISGSHALVDFTKAADQIPSPLNTVASVTASATIYAFMCLTGDGPPINHGSYQPISILTRPGTIVDALPPAAVAAGNVETSQRLVDVLFGALAQALPDRIPAASCGSMNNIAIGGDLPNGGHFTYYETIGGGMGARPGLDGLSGIHTHMTNTMNTPIEALEHSFPFIITRYGLRRGSGGKGQKKGGDGIVRGYRFLTAAEVSLLSERRSTRPYGLAGGEKGKEGSNILISRGKGKKIPGKTHFRVFPGDIVEIRTPGGGGFGPADYDET